MTEKRIVLGGIAGAVLLAGLASAATGTPALLALTPTGAAIYLIVGVAAPQLLLGRRDDDATRVGLGLLAGAAGVVVIVAGQVGVTAHGGLGFVDALAIVVVGVLVGTAAREFRRGYDGANGKNQ